MAEASEKQTGTKPAKRQPPPVMPGKVFAAITAVMAQGIDIAKDRTNKEQGYMFRGIDDIYKALQLPIAQAGLSIIPTFSDLIFTERKSANNKALIFATVTGRFRLTHRDDGSYIEVVTYGHAMDSGDKAVNKAMSVAQKYAIIQLFCLPSDEPIDPENMSPPGGGVQPETTKQPATPHEIEQDFMSRFDSSVKRIGYPVEAGAGWLRRQLATKNLKSVADLDAKQRAALLDSMTDPKRAEDIWLHIVDSVAAYFKLPVEAILAPAAEWLGQQGDNMTLEAATAAIRSEIVRKARAGDFNPPGTPKPEASAKARAGAGVAHTKKEGQFQR